MKLVLIVFSLTTFHFSASVRNPIVVVPGIGASQIEAKIDANADLMWRCKTLIPNNFFTIWANLKYCITRLPACMYVALKLTYDEKTRQTNNRSGISTRIKGFGSTDGVEYVDTSKRFTPYFSALVNRMVEEKGYIRGMSIRAAPYDFRKGPNEHTAYFEELRKLIEDTYEENENKKIILVVHSLGGLMSRIFLHKQSQEWKDKYIKYQISISTPWAGSMKALEAYIKGAKIKNKNRPKSINVTWNH